MPSEVLALWQRLDPSETPSGSAVSPRHQRIQSRIRHMIARGELRSGDKLPAELDLAESFGVSKMTVHKALQALALEGILVRSVGRGTFVADTRSNLPQFTVTIAFGETVADALGSDYYRRVYEGIIDGLADVLPGGTTLQMAAGRPELSSVADALVVMAPRPSTIPELRRIRQSGRLVAVVGARWPEWDGLAIDSDNSSGARDSIAHLVSLGHRRIAVVIAEEDTSNVQDRIAGYRDACASLGLTEPPLLKTDLVWKLDPASRAALTDSLLDIRPVTAVCAVGYNLALDVMNVVRDCGLSVPEDVSVVGFDDPLSAQLIYPALTTVRQPLYEMGFAAARDIAESLAQPLRKPPGVEQFLPTTLVVRASTGPAPDRT